MDYEAKHYGITGHENIDSRQLSSFMRLPGFAQSLTPSQLSSVEKRIATSKWSMEERIVYDAVADGYTSLDSLPIATGLTESKVRGALTSLAQKGEVRDFGTYELGTKAL